jgi:hypothetical protein
MEFFGILTLKSLPATERYKKKHRMPNVRINAYDNKWLSR